jgi:hypothetical protein
MVVVGVLVADADHTKPFGIQRLRFVLLPSLEFGLNLYIGLLPVETVNDTVDFTAFQGNGVGNADTLPHLAIANHGDSPDNRPCRAE